MSVAMLLRSPLLTFAWAAARLPALSKVMVIKTLRGPRAACDFLKDRKAHKREVGT